ncbi:hypothetical protein [Sphingomonas aerophila]|uniref:hypothetical protein n=1 Tax=Sphingomonas aerophila TaxID=1344948 RepID=UPI001C8451D8
MATLLLKVVVPSGYMIDSDHGRFAITICPGVEPSSVTMEMPGLHDHMPDHGNSKDHGKVEMPCAFSGLTAPSLAGADPLLLAAAIVFIVRTAFRTAVDTEPTGPGLHLRPPLRGPPRNT